MSGWAAEALARDDRVAQELLFTKLREAFDVERDQLRAKARSSARIVMARKIGMYMARKQMRLSFSAIGAMFNRDHTTVISAVRRIERGAKGDPVLAGIVERLCEEYDKEIRR